MTEEPIQAGRLRWRCRRGTKELDRMLGGFLEQDYARQPAEIQRAFVILLECQDPDIYDWLMGAASPDDAQLKQIVDLLRKKYRL